MKNPISAKAKFRIAILASVAVLVGVFFYFDLGTFLNLAYLKQVHGEAVAYVADNLLTSILGFFVFYVLVTALSLPGAAIMTLAGGSVFGLSWGVSWWCRLPARRGRRLPC